MGRAVNFGLLVATALSAGPLFGDLLPVIPQPREWHPAAGTCPAEAPFAAALVPDAAPGDEGYVLDVSPTGVVATAASDRGLVWARQTWRQLTRGGRAAPCGRLRDWPKWKVRAFMLDVGRKFVPMAYLKDLVRNLSYYKANVLHVHLNDDSSALFPHEGRYAAFRLECETYPGLTAKDGHYTKAEFRAFVHEAARQGVTIVPEFDTPAHSACFIDYRPSLKGVFDGTHLDLRNPETFGFVEALFAEYLGGDDPVFAGEFVHVGTDEYDPKEAEAFRSYVDRLFRLVRRYGKRPVAWGSLDHMPGRTPVASGEDIVIDAWNQRFFTPERALAAGYSVVTVPSCLYVVPVLGDFGVYFDRYNVASLFRWWEPDVFENRRFPASPRLLGGKFAIWNDLVGCGVTADDIFARFLPGLQVVAQKTWSGSVDGETYEQFAAWADEIGDEPTANVSDRLTGPDGRPGPSDRAVGWSQGGGYTVSFDLTLDRAPAEETVLFDDGYSRVYAGLRGTRCVAFACEGYEHLFDLRVSPGEKVRLRFEGTPRGVTLLANGAFVGTTVGAGVSEYVRFDGDDRRVRTARALRTLHFPLVQRPFPGRIEALEVSTGVTGHLIRP